MALHLYSRCLAIFLLKLCTQYCPSPGNNLLTALFVIYNHETNIQAETETNTTVSLVGFFEKCNALLNIKIMTAHIDIQQFYDIFIVTKTKEGLS